MAPFVPALHRVVSVGSPETVTPWHNERKDRCALTIRVRFRSRRTAESAHEPCAIECCGLHQSTLTSICASQVAVRG